MTDWIYPCNVLARAIADHRRHLERPFGDQRLAEQVSREPKPLAPANRRVHEEQRAGVHSEPKLPGD